MPTKRRLRRHVGMMPLRVVVWGLGPHAVKNIVPAVRGARGVTLHGVCSRDAGTVAAVSVDAQCRGWTNSAEMLADDSVDVVYVSTPIGLHFEHGRQVIAAGKHLWCEKPMCATVAQTEELLHSSRAAGVTMGEGFMFLYHPQFRYLRELVASSRLGKVHSVTCRFGIPELERPGFRSDPTLGGGAFLDVGSYPVAAVVSLFPGETAEVACATLALDPRSGLDTSGRALLRFSAGSEAGLEWRINSSYRNEIDFWCADGAVSTDRLFSKPADYVPRFRLRDRQGRESDERGEAANHFIAMLEAFAACVGDPRAAERERSLIGLRAALLQGIRDHASRATS